MPASVPASIPEVSILSTDDIMLEAPETIVFTVSVRPPPPITPPNIRLYAGGVFNN